MNAIIGITIIIIIAPIPNSNPKPGTADELPAAIKGIQNMAMITATTKPMTPETAPSIIEKGIAGMFLIVFSSIMSPPNVSIVFCGFCI